jgi:hypothetical protein
LLQIKTNKKAQFLHQTFLEMGVFKMPDFKVKSGNSFFLCFFVGSKKQKLHFK